MSDRIRATVLTIAVRLRGSRFIPKTCNKCCNKTWPPDFEAYLRAASVCHDNHGYDKKGFYRDDITGDRKQISCRCGRYLTEKKTRLLLGLRYSGRATEMGVGLMKR
ncbi:hypothetical protein EVAR_101948_1 [Eumeta japonica]|uniref:Uncharacterized protein n=1 Tax=Eumeta variegata TaxID=151549 RepID=A0A4C1TSF0_EUMVA|nr:hypothetical protein EVAR_101948_1 [Eumeta japonica]